LITDKLSLPLITKEDQVVTLLASLPNSNSTLLTAIEVCANDDLKLLQVPTSTCPGGDKTYQYKILTQLKTQAPQQWWEHREVDVDHGSQDVILAIFTGITLKERNTPLSNHNIKDLTLAFLSSDNVTASVGSTSQQMVK